ncbi:hypothetical protein E3O47_11105 [Cryobacterium sp. TMT2-17-1]|uniref:glycosyltransferase family 4 protein n=1 Tax=unclassified Cryobacterium TaxID=2649013 RepID=UPI001069FC35|nr:MULTISPECIES: glycosyltransferase family 4 protein [unclassified Cryobacterium]TFB54009.1 hypothetical protein E3N94_13340 [Cryobacterium sp. Sr3]TFC49473.1 hypothetical protein E3O47_11105 [Cryobacterium sp. TMT2-17-1]
MQLKGSKFLITQAHLLRYMGAEIVTLELAEYLAGQGVEVVIATHSFGYPIRQEFDRIEGVTVFELWEDALAANLQERLPDLAWIQHSIIPVVVLEHADEILFVFHHMSSILPAEFTMAAVLESALATAVLFESPRSLEIHRATGVYEDVDPDRLQVMGNAAPARFGDVSPTPNNERRITVVSNHIPPELVAAFEGIRERFDLVVIGSQSELGATPRRVTPDTLAGTDAMISIGKTVQYSIVAGVPVYCYDHFGGPGWITRANIEDARWENFSGRRAGTKTAAEIVVEISEGFDDAVAEAALVRRDWTRVYLLPERLEDLLEFVSERRRPVSKLTPQQIQGHENVQAAFGSYVREWIRMEALSNELKAAAIELEAATIKLEAELLEQEDALTTMRQEQAELYSSQLFRTLSRIRHSWVNRTFRKLRSMLGGL